MTLKSDTAQQISRSIRLVCLLVDARSKDSSNQTSITSMAMVLFLDPYSHLEVAGIGPEILTVSRS